jgi:serine/threonine protein kinase
MVFTKDVKRGEFIAQGAHGSVFHATVKNKPYALKRIQVKDERSRQCVEREVEILSDCAHPSILKVHHYWEEAHDEDMVVWVLMDLCTKVLKLTMKVHVATFCYSFIF